MQSRKRRSLPDVTFTDVVSKLSGWSQGTLGAVIRISWLLVSIAIGVKTQRIVVPLAVGLALFYMPSVVDAIFGAIA